MKKLLFVITLVLSVVQIQAQKPEVTAIRKAYAAAKETVAKYEKDPKAFYCSKTEVVSDYIVDGNGPAHEVVQYYYQGEWDDEVGTTVFSPFFISRKFSDADGNLYEEYLFDADNQGLIFYYQKQADGSETRYYWGRGGLVEEKINGTRGTDEVFAARMANDIKASFDRLMNREY